jgi:hypothetical protein
MAIEPAAAAGAPPQPVLQRQPRFTTLPASAGEALARSEHGPHAPSASVLDGEPARRDADHEDSSAALAQLRVANLFGRTQQAPPAAGASGNGDASSSLTSGPWLTVYSHPSRCPWVAAAAAWPLCCAEPLTGIGVWDWQAKTFVPMISSASDGLRGL